MNSHRCRSRPISRLKNRSTARQPAASFQHDPFYWQLLIKTLLKMRENGAEGIVLPKMFNCSWNRSTWCQTERQKQTSDETYSVRCQNRTPQCLQDLLFVSLWEQFVGVAPHNCPHLPLFEYKGVVYLTKGWVSHLWAAVTEAIHHSQDNFQ